jgi:hypothetical protein
MLNFLLVLVIFYAHRFSVQPVKLVNFVLPVLVNLCADQFPLTSKASLDYSTNKASDFLFYEHYQSVSN